MTMSCLVPVVAAALLPSGRLELGANYWSSQTATQMWSKWSADEVERDLVALKSAGFTLLRVFANWAEFQPIVEIHRACGGEKCPRETRMFLTEERRPGTPAGHAGVDERMMERFEAFCGLAERHGFRLIVCPLTGQMTFRLFLPPAFEGKNVYTDPYCLKWEGRYLEYFVVRLRKQPSIAAWEIGNEVCVINETPHHDAPEFWLRYLHDVIRRADATRPVIGPDGLNLREAQPWNAMMTSLYSDFLTTHPYAMWGNASLEDFNGIRNAFFCASQTRALADVGGRPAFVEEHGARRREQVNPVGLSRYVRGLLWNLWAADCRGLLWWCAFDQTGLDIVPYDWPEPCVELGLFSRDRRPSLAATAFAAFAKFQRALPFDALPAAKPDALFVVSDPDIVHASYILARQAGIVPTFQSAEQPIRKAGVYFLPDAKGRAGLSIRNWEAIKANVRAGATLYLSWHDTFLDSLDEVCGVEVAYRDKNVTRLASVGAEVIEKDADGAGVFFRHRYGEGTVYTLAYPMERKISDGVGGFATDAYCRYHVACPVAKHRLLRTNARDVTVSEHLFDSGRCAVIVVNNGTEPYASEPSLSSGWRVRQALTDDSDAATWKEPRLDLQPHSGILLLLEKVAHEKPLINTNLATVRPSAPCSPS